VGGVRGIVGGVRGRRLTLEAAYHLSVLSLGLVCVMLGIELANRSLFDAGGLLLLFHLLTFQRLPLIRWIQIRLIQKHRCGQCGQELDLVTSWRCGCKYVSPERHAFTPCPNCGKGFAWVSCPACGTGTLI
jgi:hypothetical protein